MPRKKSRRPGSPRREAPSSGVRERVFAAVAAVRRAHERGKKLSISKAAGQEGTTVAAIKRFPQLLKRTKPNKPPEVTAGDSYRRRVHIYIPLRFRDGDVRTVAVYSYNEAQLGSRYLHTVDQVRRGKLPPSALDEFKGVRLGREKYPLLTDWEKIKRLTDAGITVTEFYAKPIAQSAR